MNSEKKCTWILSVLCGLGLYVSSNANPVLTPGTWVNITPPGIGFNNNENMIAQGIAFDPNNRSTIYWCNTPYGYTYGGIWKSTNGGSNWRKVGLVPSGSGPTSLDEPLHVRIDPNNSNHLYVGDGVRGGTQGFWVSTDGGEHFTQPQGWLDAHTATGYFINDIYDIAVDPSDFNHVLASSHSAWKCNEGEDFACSAGIMESTDGGASWIAHKPIAGWGAGHCVKFLYDPAKGIGNNRTWLVGTQGGGNWRTTDGGANWTRVYPAGTGIVHGGGTIYYSKTGVLYFSNYPQTLRSTDNGINWIPVGPDGGTTGICGDGNLLYTARTLGNGTPYWTSPETDGITWTPFNGGKQTFQNGGPFEMAFDSVNSIMYSSNWEQGCWALAIPKAATSIGSHVAAIAQARSSVKNGVLTIFDDRGNLASNASLFDITGRLVGGSGAAINAIGHQMLIVK